MLHNIVPVELLKLKKKRVELQQVCLKNSNTEGHNSKLSSALNSVLAVKLPLCYLKGGC